MVVWRPGGLLDKPVGEDEVVFLVFAEVGFHAFEGGDDAFGDLFFHGGDADDADEGFGADTINLDGADFSAVGDHFEFGLQEGLGAFAFELAADDGAVLEVGDGADEVGGAVAGARCFFDEFFGYEVSCNVVGDGALVERGVFVRDPIGGCSRHGREREVGNGDSFQGTKIKIRFEDVADDGARVLPFFG